MIASLWNYTLEALEEKHGFRESVVYAYDIGYSHTVLEKRIDFIDRIIETYMWVLNDGSLHIDMYGYGILLDRIIDPNLVLEKARREGLASEQVAYREVISIYSIAIGKFVKEGM